MANDRAIGGAIFGGSIVGIIIYGLLLWYWGGIVVEITAFLGIAVLLGILAWIGYTMATTPPPEPITDIPEMSPAAPAGASGDKKDEPAKPA
jgi:predicted DNA-binding transcriptional regulator